MDELGFKSIGVDYLLGKSNLKRDLLYFDKIVFDESEFETSNTLIEPTAKVFFGEESKELLRFQNAELEYLQENKLVEGFNSKSLEKIAYDKNLTFFTKQFDEHKKRKTLFSRSEILNMQSVFHQLDAVHTGRRNDAISIYRTYFICSLLNETRGLRSIPILDNFVPETTHNQGKEYKIVEMVVNKFPTIDDQISWEQIIDFKSDPDSKRKFLALRNWMIDVSKGNLTAKEVGEKIDFLLSEYSFHLDRHKINSNLGVIKSFLITTGDILGNILKLNLGKSIKTTIEIFEHKTRLTEIESNLPGREIGYIYLANKKLGDSKR